MEASFSQCSPMLAIEPILAEFCLQLNRMAKSITQQEFLCLTNHIIEGTRIETRLKAFQQSIGGSSGETNFGKKYFYNFMKEHSNIIHTTKIHNQFLSRLEWAMYHNIEKMCSLIYTEMVNSGIAKQLDSFVYFNKDNTKVPEGDASIVGTSTNAQV
jgi:hypothetical protein